MDENKELKNNKKQKPKKTENTWNIVGEVLRRELGDFQKSTNAFARDCYASKYTVKRMKLSHHLNQPAGEVQVINFNNSGELLCAGFSIEKDKKNNIGLIDWAQNEVIAAVSTIQGAKITDLHFLNVENYEKQLSVVSVYDNGQFRCNSLTPSGAIEILHTYELTQECHKLAKCPGKHNELLSAATSGTISHIDLRCDEPTILAKTIPAESNIKLQSMSHHPLAPQICASYDDYCVRVFDTRKFDHQIHEICPESLKSLTKPAQISDAFYNYDGSEILAIYTDKNIFLLDSENKHPGEFIKTYNQMGFLAGFTNKTSFFGPKSEYVLVGDDGQRIAFIDKLTGKYVAWTALWPHSRWCSSYFLDLKSHPNLPIVACASAHFSILSPTSVDKGTDLPPPKNANVPTTKAVKATKYRKRTLLHSGKQCSMQ